MLAGAPGMASDYMQQRTAPQPTSVYDVERPVSAPGTEDGILKPQKDIVYFDALSLLSVFQVLCAIVIFTCGMLRLIWHAKWAIGVELAFAVYVFICGIMGIYANTKRSHCAAVGTYVMSAFATFAALIPLILGLFPTIPLTFPSADSDSFVNEDESRLVDYLLSFACFVELVVALITSIYGCQSIGTTMTHVEKLRLNADLNAAFESSSTSLPKSSQHSNRNAAALHLEKKASLQF
ncbi:unnamed protein product [Anisakis simplex]|uniref:MARVEL domain-containing protein n=1 Tax=Anisakis simplex TaxID=6269 RepID=A0A0M3KBI4_ANISI|nr:unnamed protein product [Anisakis simplex]